MARRRAQALPEFALVLVVFLLFTIGTMQWAWWMMESGKLGTALDRAVSEGNAGVHEEYVLRYCSASCQPGGLQVVRPLPDGEYGPEILPQASARALEVADHLVRLSGGKRDISVSVRYRFSGGRGQMLVSGSFVMDGLVRLAPMPTSWTFTQTRGRELEIFAR